MENLHLKHTFAHQLVKKKKEMTLNTPKDLLGNGNSFFNFRQDV